MRRRIRVRLAMFLVLFVAICAAAVAMDAWAEPAASCVEEPVVTQAVAEAPDAEWAGPVRRQAIACGGAMATVAAFAVTLGRGGQG